MRDDEAFSRLAQHVYDAALDPTVWPRAIEDVARFVGGVAGWLTSRDCVTGAGEILYGTGDLPDYRKLYLQIYIHLDPLNQAILALKPGQTTCHSTVIPRNEFVESQLYKEWIRPQGWLENAFIVLDRSAVKITCLGIARGAMDGWVDDSVVQRLQLIAPHLRRAVLAGTAVRQTAARAATLTGALNGFDAAIFFVDAEGFLLHANANGAAMLKSGFLTGAIVAGQQLPEGSEGAVLLEIYVRACRTCTADNQRVCIPLRSRYGEQFVLHALPLSTGVQPEARHRAVAALFIKKAAIGGVKVAEAIAQRYRLTPAELRVLLMIVEGGGALETARAIGIAKTTVKTHLRSIFAKTGSARQLELAKLVAGFSSGLSN